ncbi:MAG: hypothetical protein IKK38_12835 [Spirochaetaceae bacterium]|nr:hypothetical protein [Spirochaetaceae bacterium]
MKIGIVDTAQILWDNRTSEQLETERLKQIAHYTATNTARWNEEYTEVSQHLNNKRKEYKSRLEDKLASNPNYTADRNKGVKLAWQYEQEVIKMGGTGTRNWTAQEKDELLKNGIVRGIVGHHEQSVSAHPEEQANPDNISFLTREEHLQKHGGDFRNATDGKMKDKDRLLERTNRTRVFKNEVGGFVNAIAPDMLCTFAAQMLEQSKSTVDDNSRKPAKTKILNCCKIAVAIGADVAFKYLDKRIS